MNEKTNSDARGVAINVGANTNAPGFRGPIYPDGRFEYVPIPEVKPVRADVTVPTYGDLDLSIDTAAVTDEPVHLDPTFEGVHGCDRYTYGDPHGVKATPLLDLEAGDYVLFYATLSPVSTPARAWITPDWGAYVIGEFVLGGDPIPGEDFLNLPEARRDRFVNNAHLKRREFDAAVLLWGDPGESKLFEIARPLSAPDRGIEPNRIVRDLSADSGKGPWWRRPLRFDASAMDRLQTIWDEGMDHRL